jgi:hypothetical protein
VKQKQRQEAKEAHVKLMSVHSGAEWATGNEQREDGVCSASAAMTALRNYAYHLACVRPSMAAVAGVAVDVVAATDECLRGRADAFETDAGHVWDAVLEVTRGEGVSVKTPETPPCACT